MPDVYEEVPVLKDERWLLRQLKHEDVKDLFKVYSDKAAVPFFNSDNCHGDTFYYDTEKRMEQAVEFWEFSYKERYFVRWSIVDQKVNEVIGTIELFRRASTDFYNEKGVLRLDLRSDYEETSYIAEILGLIVDKAFELFDCDMIATKGTKDAAKRREALSLCGFKESEMPLVADDKTEYREYFTKDRQ